MSTGSMCPECAGYSCGQEQSGRDQARTLLLGTATFHFEALGKISFPKCTLGPRGGRHEGKAQVPRRFPRERLLTGHGAVDDVELVAVQHGLTAELLQLLIAAVMRQAASGGQTRGDEGLCLEVGPGESAGKDHLPPPLGKKGLKVGA